MSQHTSLEDQIVARAAQDATFRQNLLRAPQATLEKEFGITLPAGASIKIQVHKESETVLRVVLPSSGQAQMVELDDSQLASVDGAGGGNTRWVTG